MKAGALGASELPRRNDYLIWYAKNVSNSKYRQLYTAKDPEEDAGAYRLVQEPSGKVRPLKGGENLSEVALMRYVLMTKPGPKRKEPLSLSAIGSSFATLSKFSPDSDKQRWLFKTQ